MSPLNALSRFLNIWGKFIGYWNSTKLQDNLQWQVLRMLESYSNVFCFFKWPDVDLFYIHDLYILFLCHLYCFFKKNVKTGPRLL